MTKGQFDFRSVVEVATLFITEHVGNGSAAQLQVSYNGTNRPTVFLRSQTKTIELTPWIPVQLPKMDPVTLSGGFDSWREYITSPRGLGQQLESIANAMSKGVIYKEGLK